MHPAAANETLTIDFAASGTQSNITAPNAQHFGEFELLEEIGRGGMGIVYKARQRSLNRIVAIKMILAGQLASADELRRFRTEAEATALLDHPNIVPVYEAGEQDGQTYFVMAFVKGQTLADYLNDGPMGPFRAAQLALVLAEAIHHAHEKGVIHRDLKPANILLVSEENVEQPNKNVHIQDAHLGSKRGLKVTPRITDFGLAKQIGDDARVGLTATGQILGTPSYMAPEQAAARHEKVGPATDIYAISDSVRHGDRSAAVSGGHGGGNATAGARPGARAPAPAECERDG